ncbi:hypothetical protein H8959_013936, partial [Pygathrix nigripes]
MARGPKKHLKWVAAPKHWMLDKLTGVFAPRPSTGPHKLRECLPLIIFLRNRLKYALTGDEVKKICMQRFIKIDGKVRTDITYPAGFMDIISIDKTGENFCLIYDTKGRFAVHRITPEEAKYKLCKVRKIFVGTKGIPHLVTHDARTIRYPDLLIKVNDTIQIDLEIGKITDFIKFDTGNLCMVTGGANLGRIGVITNRERHPGSFDVVHVKDANGNSFATRLSNIFVIGKGNKPWISLPRGKGIRPPLLKRETKDWRPNRAVGEMGPWVPCQTFAAWQKEQVKLGATSTSSSWLSKSLVSELVSEALSIRARCNLDCRNNTERLATSFLRGLRLSQQKPKSHREPAWKKAGIKNASVSPAQHSSMTGDKYIWQIAYQTAVTT